MLTILTNVYNEEYLLPFWLNHHKNICDHGIVVDYHSTDSSMEIVRRICPTWTIITTRNSQFDAFEIDREFMDLEKNIDGYKIVLNTTEFLMCPSNLKDLLPKSSNRYIRIQCLVPFSSNDNFYPLNLTELLCNIDRAEPNKRFHRFLHSYDNGHYSIGRHYATLPITDEISAYILWFGFYPWNPDIIERKLQIKNNIPDSDKRRGFGAQHLWSVKEMNSMREIYKRDSIKIDNYPALDKYLKGVLLD